MNIDFGKGLMPVKILFMARNGIAGKWCYKKKTRRRKIMTCINK